VLLDWRLCRKVGGVSNVKGEEVRRLYRSNLGRISGQLTKLCRGYPFGLLDHCPKTVLSQESPSSSL